MDASLLAILTEAEQAMSSATDPASLENIKAQFLGKQGKVTELLKGMAALSPEEKKTRGAEINQLKQQVEAVLNAKRQALADSAMQAKLHAQAIDVTKPGRMRGTGGLHPAMHTLERIEEIFTKALTWIQQSSIGIVCFRGATMMYEQTPWVKLLLQVHDSVVFQYPMAMHDQLWQVHDALHSVVIPYDDPLCVPWELKVSTKSWGDCESLPWAKSPA